MHSLTVLAVPILKSCCPQGHILSGSSRRESALHCFQLLSALEVLGTCGWISLFSASVLIQTFSYPFCVILLCLPFLVTLSIGFRLQPENPGCLFHLKLITFFNDHCSPPNATFMESGSKDMNISFGGSPLIPLHMSYEFVEIWTWRIRLKELSFNDL